MTNSNKFCTDDAVYFDEKTALEFSDFLRKYFRVDFIRGRYGDPELSAIGFSHYYEKETLTYTDIFDILLYFSETWDNAPYALIVNLERARTFAGTGESREYLTGELQTNPNETT